MMAFNLNESSIVEAFNNTEELNEISKKISQDIVQKSYDILQFVQSLGFALTSTKVKDRVNAIKLLSLTITYLPEDYFNEPQLNYIVNFYCDRLKDHHNTIPPILDGFKSLIKMKYIKQGATSKLLRSIFDNVICQSQVREDRMKIFELFNDAVNYHFDEINKMGIDFIYGVMSATDGERDPRNLEFLFKILPNFIKKFPLQHLSEEMFEIFACYFPIDFYPSKSDPAAITRDSLANELANCLVATEDFAEWTMNLLLEKLESDLNVAKLDSLELLKRCAQSFQTNTLNKNFDKIWIVLKNEIFPGNDNNDIIAAGLLALKSVLKKGALNKEISRNMQTIVLSNILIHLSDATHRLFSPSKSIAYVCVESDALFSSDKILNSLTIKLEDNTLDNEQIGKLLDFMNQVLYICSTKNCISDLNGKLFDNLQKHVILILSTKAKEANLLVFASKLICTSFTFFSKHNRYICYKRFSDILRDENLNIVLREVLKNIALHFSEELKKELIDPILNDFLNSPFETKRNVLANFSVLINYEEFTPKVLNLIVFNVFDTTSLETQTISLEALKNLLMETENGQRIALKLYLEYNFLDKSISLIHNTNFNLNFLNEFSIVLQLFVSKLNINEQEIILRKYLLIINPKITTDLFIIKGIVSNIDENINANELFDQLVGDLIELSLTSNDSNLKEIYQHLLCSLSNKTVEKGFIDKYLLKLKNEIESHNKTAIETLSWISKGLIIGGYLDIGAIVKTIADLLEQPNLSETAELAFEVISMEVPQLHLPIVKYLYKQKLFHIVLKYLWNKLNEFSNKHINAFAYILRITPYNVIKMHLEQIGPVLFRSLEIEKLSTVQISLEICKSFLEDQNDYFKNHLSHLIQQFLKLSQNTNWMSVRILAIECLEVICKYPEITIIPFKSTVIFELVPTLDDKKRLVRNAAVKARNNWFLIG